MKTKVTTPAPANTTMTQCANCNGDLTFNPAAQTLDCAFCSTSYSLTGEMVNAGTTVTEAPKFIIPFAFAKEVFDKAAMQWLSLGDYTPADVLDGFRNGSTKGVYVPVYSWDVDYYITDPMGNRHGKTVVIDVPGAIAKWPAQMSDLAKSAIQKKGSVKPFDQVYTLGFEMLEDDVTDVEDFNAKAQALALKTVAGENNLHDSKMVVITNMVLTKIYSPFWRNTHQWQDQDCEVIMSGYDASAIGGKRPVDNNAKSATGPSYKIPVFIILAGIGLICLDIADKLPKGVENAASVISILMWMLIGPIGIIITFIRKMFWTNPAVKLKKEREQRLAQMIAR